MRTSYTYTHSVKDPRSDKERYMRAAPMDLLFVKSEPVDSGKGRGREDEQDSDYSRDTQGGFDQSRF